MDIEKTFPYQLLEGTIGIPIEIISNDFQETPGYEGLVCEFYENAVMPRSLAGEFH